MKLHCAFSNNYIYGYNCIVYIVQHYQERHILSELGVFMVCPHLWFALTIYLPYIWFTLRIFLEKMESYENYNWWFALLPECPTIYGLPSLMVYPTCGLPYAFCGQNWRLWKLQLLLYQLWFALTDGLPYMWYTLLKFWLLWMLHFNVSFLEVYSLFIYCWKWIFNSWQIKLLVVLLIKSHLHFDLILVLGLILQWFTNFKMAPNPRFLAMETFCNGWFTLRTGLDWGTFSRLCRIWWSCLFWSG